MATLRQADKHCDALNESAGLTLIRTSRGLEHAAHTLALLPQSGGALIEELMTACQSAENRGLLSEFIRHIEVFRAGLATMSASAVNVNALLDAHDAEELSHALECFSRWGLRRMFYRAGKRDTEHEYQHGDAAG